LEKKKPLDFEIWSSTDLRAEEEVIPKPEEPKKSSLLRKWK
jgi:hypothetical protein